MGKLLFTTLAMIAEFQADLTRLRTREGMKMAKAKAKGRAPKLSAKQEAHLVALHKAGEHTDAELTELFGVARSTVYRAIERAAAARLEAAR
jgi:DNA invertase Pin-like site-specific DNA recombinase